MDQQQDSYTDTTQTTFRRFRYEGRIAPIIAGIAFTSVSLIASVMGAFDPRDFQSIDGIAGEITMSFLTVVVTLIFINAFIRTSDILVDDDGIRWLIFGKEQNVVRWSDVKRIRVWNTPDYANFGPPINGYTLHTTSKFRLIYSRNPPFFITDKVTNCRDLLDIINVHVRPYNVPITDCRVKPPRPLSQL